MHGRFSMVRIAVVGMLVAALGACKKEEAASPEPAPNEPASQEHNTGSGDTEEDESVSAIERQLAGESDGEVTDLKTEEWLAILRTELPKEFCKDGTYFRTCFAIDKNECMRVSAAQFDPCVRKHRHELPNIRTEEDGGKGGEILGRCTGASFFEALQSKFKNTAKCNDPNAW